MQDLISRQAAIDALWKALFEYEDKTEKQFQESEDLDVGDWIEHRIFVQNMNDIDRQTILNLPSAQPGWIPCSERLPEEYGEFLVTMTEKAKAKDLGFDIDKTYIGKMRYNSNGWQLPRHIPSWINEAVKDEVLAWMPLPEPYQEEGEKDGKDT